MIQSVEESETFRKYLLVAVTAVRRVNPKEHSPTYLDIKL